MICSRCGNEIEEGKLFCPVCGQEVQLVPDFDTFGEQYYRKQQEERKRENLEREYLPEDNDEDYEFEERRSQERSSVKKKKKKKKKANPLIIGGIILVLCMICLLAFKSTMDKRNDNSYSYQMNKAETAFTNKEYEKALEYLDRAVKLQPADEDAILLRAQVYVGLEREDEAIKDLEALISVNPNVATAYGVLLRLYESQEQPDKIKDLMDSCENEKIRKKYQSYISLAPTALPAGGSYRNEVELVLSAEEGSTIYYTTDGSTATTGSTRYTGPIVLSEEKTITVCAIAVNDKGVISDPFIAAYTISIDVPEPPKITLSPGTYTTDMDTTIYLIVPDGCKAYYEFDEEPDQSSRAYQDSKGIRMPEGTHTLYAIVENKYGKISDAASQTYTLKNPDEDDPDSSSDTEQ